MIRKNLVWSFMLIALSTWLFQHVTNFPTLPQQSIGAATFPQIIAGLLAICGAYLAFEKTPALNAPLNPTQSNTLYQSYCIVGLLCIPLSCAFLSENIGFALAMGLSTTASMILFRRGKVMSSIVICCIFSAFVYVVFTKTLLVPLTPGPLNTAFGI